MTEINFKTLKPYLSHLDWVTIVLLENTPVMENFTCVTEVSNRYDECKVVSINKSEFEYPKEEGKYSYECKDLGNGNYSCPCMKIVLSPFKCHTEQKALTLKDVRPLLPESERYSVCMKETLAYENVHFLSDVPQAYDDLYVYGIGRRELEFPIQGAPHPERVEGNQINDRYYFDDCIELYLAKQPRGKDLKLKEIRNEDEISPEMAENVVMFIISDDGADIEYIPLFACSDGSGMIVNNPKSGMVLKELCLACHEFKCLRTGIGSCLYIRKDVYSDVMDYTDYIPDVLDKVNTFHEWASGVIEKIFREKEEPNESE